ncbi:TPA: hypothetical protein ACGA30_000119 [Clostridium perfringens]
MIKKLFLDLNNFKANLGSVERGDSIELNIKLLDGEDYSRSKFRVLGAKADGKYVEQIEGINLEEKDLKIVLEDQFVNCEGIVKLELNVVSSETEITTKEFYFFVSNTMNAEIIDSVDSIKTLEKVSKYVDDAVNNLDALKEASEDITIINSEFKENEIKRKANEMLREKNEKARLQSEDIRITEEEEREANELERIKAENNRKASENNRKVSENTRVTNERAREEAELSRQSTFEENEEIRNSNENLRIESEKERIKFNNKAKTDEVNRKEAETKRVEAEKTRVIAEDERKKAETSRQEAEDIRQNTYTNFNEAEEERRNNEISRQEAEVLRIEAEKRRDDLYSQKEEERNAAFLESERTRGTAFNEAQNDRNLTFEESEAIREEAFKVSEVARNEAEDGRVAAELLRVEAEKLRVTGEENRNATFTQSEEERKATFEEAENARKVAESKRVKAESSRVEVEKLRATAENGRVEAENLRVTAEEERVAAETKREECFNKFEGKINANTEELKLARSATTGEEFNSLDERIDHEVDRLNKKNDVTMLQQEDKESHTIDNSIEGLTTDMIIKGRSLQNLCKSNNTLKTTTSGDHFLNNDLMFGWVENETYTFIFTIDKPCDTVGISFRSGNNAVIDGTSTNSYGAGTHLVHFTPTKKCTVNPKIVLSLRNVNSIITVKDFFVIKGTINNLLSYFEGIKSFGQQEDKISTLSSGKNLCKVNKFSVVAEGSSASSYSSLDRVIEANIEVDPTKTYTLSYTSDIPHFDNCKLLGCNVKLPSTVINHNGAYTFCTNNGGQERSKQITGFKYITITTGGSISSTIIKVGETIKIIPQLEEGTQPTSYETYKEYKKDIALTSLGFDEGLRGFNLTICDELNDIKNVAIKRVGKKIITSELPITLQSINVHGIANFAIPIDDLYKDRVGFCNKLILQDTLIADTMTEGFTLSVGARGAFIRVKSEKASNVEEFKQYLATLNEPIVIYYPCEPVETHLDESIALKAFNEKTYVSFENAISGTSSFKAPVNAAATISRLNRENRALEEENRSLRQDFESTTLSLTDSDLELVKQNVDIDFRLMEVEFALDIPQSTLSSNINFKKKGEVKSMARTPYAMMKIVILSGDYDREDYIHKVGKYYERGRMTKEEYDELMSLMTADEVISK